MPVLLQQQPAAVLQPAAAVQPAAPSGSTAEEEAEAALRYLEAEWTMRMEAPIAALAGMEATLAHAIEDAARGLPFPPPDAPL